MGLIIKQKQIAKGFNTEVYIKIDSVRAGMGESGLITCSCGEWLSTKSRSAGEEHYKANVIYHISDGKLSGSSVIDAVYPLLKADLEKQGYEVLDDTNCYAEQILNQY